MVGRAALASQYQQKCYSECAHATIVTGTACAEPPPVQLAQVAIDPERTASVASLNYATDDAEGIIRRKRGKGFAYATTGATRAH